MITYWCDNFLVYQYTMSIGMLLSDDNLISWYKNNKSVNLLTPVILCGAIFFRSYTLRQVYRLDPFISVLFLLAASQIPNLLCDYINKIFPERTVTFMWLTHTFFCFYYFQNWIYETQSIGRAYLLTVLTSLILSRLLNFIYDRIGFGMRILCGFRCS